MSAGKVSTPRADGLNKLTHTFTSDQEFCEALAATQAWNVGRLLVYLGWAQNCMNPIQEELQAIAGRHFEAKYVEDAGTWSMFLTGGILKDLCLITYLAVRGLVSESGIAVRRSLENVGVLSHLWKDPSKAQYLGDPDSIGFKHAFVAETDKQKAADLKMKGIQKRFAAFHPQYAKGMSDLYRLLSTFMVHGGSLKSLANVQMEPNRVSCKLMNRPDPLETDLSRQLGLLCDGCELLCMAVATIHSTQAAKYGLFPSKAWDGIIFLTDIMGSKNKNEMANLIKITLNEMGWQVGMSDNGPIYQQ